MTYKPSVDDIIWATQMLKSVKNLGTMVFPTTQLVYIVNHDERMITLMNPSVLKSDKHSAQVHHRTIQVFGVVGYHVVEAGVP